MADNAIDATIMVDPRDEPRAPLQALPLEPLGGPGTARASTRFTRPTASASPRRAGSSRSGPRRRIIADWDPRIGSYVVYLRVFVRNVENQRRVGRIETDDLLKPWPFSPTEPLLEPTLAREYADGPLPRRRRTTRTATSTPMRHASIRTLRMST